MATCIYCPNEANSREHGIPRGLGAFRGYTPLRHQVCGDCNQRDVPAHHRAAEALDDYLESHTFRATGITAYLSNGGTLEHAQQIAGHASPKTTKLYDRTADTITVDEIERIVI